MTSLDANARAKAAVCPRERRRLVRVEVLVGAVVVLASLGMAGRFDLFLDLTVLERVLMPVLAATAAIAAIGWRRYFDARAEAGLLSGIEAELAETSERYRSLFDYHPDGVFQLDNDGRLVAVNAAAIQMSGYTPEEMVKLEIPDYVEEHEIERVTGTFRALLANHMQRLETRVVRKDGTTLDVAITGLPVIVGGVAAGAFGIAEDITERNRMQYDLEYARQIAEDASEAKSLFLANMSHEIRTPLTSVLAASEMLEDTVTTEAQRRLVETMQRSGSRLLRLVDDILDFSRIEAGQTNLRDDLFDLHGLLQELAANKRVAADAKGVELTCTIDPAVPLELLGDADRVSQIVGNLLDNAVKFTDHGSVRLDASRDGTGEHGAVVIKVTDTGIGMSAEQQERIFESFRQADAGITRYYGGTGLGLAICRQLVELMGGSITVDSTFAEGTEFTIRVPLGLVSTVETLDVRPGVDDDAPERRSA